VEALEVEIKIRFGDAESARRAILAAGGIETRPRHFEDNRLFDTPAGDLVARQALLRVRETSDGVGVLTFKEKVAGETRAKVRREWEVRVASPADLAAILERCGFVGTYRYQKYRTEFSVEGATVDLDETPMGCFVEIEAPMERLAALAASLGARDGDRLVEDYRSLYHAWLAERGLPPADMVFTDR